MTPAISLATAAALTGLSTRTLRRWIVEGRAIVQRVDVPHDPAGRTFVQLDPLRMHIGIALEPEDVERVIAADGGDAAAQNDIGAMFLGARRYRQALHWFEMAAEGGCADAMHWLARCNLAGWGCAVNRHRGLMWLAKAADRGHVISTQMVVGAVSWVTAGRHAPSAASHPLTNACAAPGAIDADVTSHRNR